MISKVNHFLLEMENAESCNVNPHSRLCKIIHSQTLSDLTPSLLSALSVLIQIPHFFQMMICPAIFSKNARTVLFSSQQHIILIVICHYLTDLRADAFLLQTQAFHAAKLRQGRHHTCNHMKSPDQINSLHSSVGRMF